MGRCEPRSIFCTKLCWFCTAATGLKLTWGRSLSWAGPPRGARWRQGGCTEAVCRHEGGSPGLGRAVERDTTDLRLPRSVHPSVLWCRVDQGIAAPVLCGIADLSVAAVLAVVHLSCCRTASRWSQNTASWAACMISLLRRTGSTQTHPCAGTIGEACTSTTSNASRMQG